MLKFSVMLPVLIPSEKHLAMTYKCLTLAKKYTSLPFELVIVESGSQYLSDEADVYINEKVPSTPEHGHNIGWKVCSGDYITLLTNDVYVSEGWLEALHDCFLKKEDCGASTLASTQFSHIKENKIEEGNWWGMAMIPKYVFDKVGYYDERFVNAWCDTDLLLRMYKAGYKMYRNFNCVVEHLVGQTNYAKPSFNKDYEAGRKLFNEKHDGCELPLFEVMR